MSFVKKIYEGIFWMLLHVKQLMLVILLTTNTLISLLMIKF